MNRKRLSICYIVPGHDLVSSMGPTRNTISLARALGRWADVTVAFRRIVDTQPPNGLRVLEIQPNARAATIDDSAMRGIGYTGFVSYLRALRRFARRELREFDIVLEKSWLISGYISSLCRRRGQLAIPVENIVPNPSYAAGRKVTKLVRIQVGRWLAGRYLRSAPLIIAETEFLKNAITRYWRVPEERIEVVNLGVDRKLFRPRDQAEARQRLGISGDKTILLYVGVMDATHNLEPAITALGNRRDLELHIVGDGVRRRDCEKRAAMAECTIVFHGRVPHQQVPWYIAAADLCLAPYDPSAFAGGDIGYSTMKIPEYLSTGCPVVSVPSGRIRELVDDSQTGFLFANEVTQWQHFLSNLPPRERLREMGAVAARVKLNSWEDTARAYMSLIERHLQPVGSAAV